MKRILILVLAIVGSFSSVQAKADVIRCGQCSSVAMMESEAVREGDGNHIVYSYRHGMISAWTVDVNIVWRQRQGEYIGEPTITTTSTQTTVPADMVGAFEALVPLYDATAGTMRLATQINLLQIDLDGRYGATNSYDFLSDYGMRSAIGDAIADKGGMIAPLDLLSNAGAKYISVLDGPILTVTLVFDDGSEVKYEVTLIGYGEYAAEYKKNSARTSSGSAIPEANSPEYEGTYYIGSGEGPGFIDHIRGMGGTFTGVGTGMRILVCTWDGVTLTCRPY